MGQKSQKPYNKKYNNKITLFFVLLISMVSCNLDAVGWSCFLTKPIADIEVPATVLKDSLSGAKWGSKGDAQSRANIFLTSLFCPCIGLFKYPVLSGLCYVVLQEDSSN